MYYQGHDEDKQTWFERNISVLWVAIGFLIIIGGFLDNT